VEYTARLPDGIMPCCDVVTAARRSMATDHLRHARCSPHRAEPPHRQVWNKTTSDYQAGYSATAAPLIVKDMVITGNSGGEFGIIGEVQARNVDTGELIWSRPTIEGHIGTLKGQPNGMTGKLNATWQGDMYKTGGGATWLGGTYDPETNLLFFGTGNPARGTATCAPATTCYLLDAGDRSRTRA
jgi:alcohol dehydrogenase (cytochrome c)